MDYSNNNYEDDLNAAILASLHMNDDVPSHNLLGYVSPLVNDTPPKRGRGTRRGTTRIPRVTKPRKVVVIDDDFEFDEPVRTPTTISRTREEVEKNARSTTRIEEARKELAITIQPLEHARTRYFELLSQLEMAKKEMNILEETHRVCVNVIEDASAIIEHQNTEMDRATMMDLYGVDVSKVVETKVVETKVVNTKVAEAKVTPIQEIPEVKQEVPIPTLDGADGEPVKLRFVYPNGVKEDHIANSQQTMGVIAAFASCQYLRPLRVAGIPGVVLTPTTTLESIGMVKAAVIKFYE